MAARRPQHVSGFTLVEILIVLVIAALLSSIALPRLQGLVQSIEISGQRENLLDELNGLGYKAFASGKPITLAERANVNSSLAIEPIVRLPDGWQLSVANPIQYAFNGVCSGGKIMIVAPNNSKEIFQLEPPLCQLEPSSESLNAWK